MHYLNDTITAVSSPTNDHRVIIRLSGPHTIDILNQIYIPAVPGNSGITSGKIMNFDCVIYLFRQPHSYTGDDLAEIHLWANPAITEVLLEHFLELGTRTAGAGEFTARAYLNGKIDLAQAEAVNEVITASNTFQLAAAENLLAGRFGQTIGAIRSTILDLLSRLEAGLDFSTEDTGPTNQAEIITALDEAPNKLRELLAGSINNESTLDLPAVGIAGAPNAGKSTLLNKLLGRQRSIVSHQRKTTRDVLTGEIVIENCRCVLFDCAGLTTNAETILDELAQQAAIEALRNATVIIFCADIAKPDWSEDLAVLSHCEAISLIPLATKTDLFSDSEITERVAKLKSLFGFDFLPVSSKTGKGLQELRKSIARKIIEMTFGTSHEPRATSHGLALTARHRQAITASIADLEKTIAELKAGNDEVAAMMLRTAHSQLSNIEQSRLVGIDEQVLDRIFSRFCIGK